MKKQVGKKWTPRKRQWWEEPLDIRIHERLSEQILNSLTGVGDWNRKIRTLDPLRFEKYLSYAMPARGYDLHRRIKRKVQRAFEYLEKAQFITEREGKFTLTPKGWIRYAWNYSMAMKKLQKKRVKKGALKKWFIVIFDIPEELRRFRDSLRRTLYNLGFSQLQRSVFVSHDIQSFDFISKIVSQSDLFDRVKLIVGDQIL